MTFVFFGLLSVAALGGMAVLLYRHAPHKTFAPRILSIKLPRVRLGVLRSAVQKVWAKNPVEFPVRLVGDVAKRAHRPSFLRESKGHSLKGIELQALSPNADNEDFWIRLISGDSENPYLYKKLGEFYLRQKQRQHARQTFEYAARLAPEDASIKKYLGQLQ